MCQNAAAVRAFSKDENKVLPREADEWRERRALSHNTLRTLFHSAGLDGPICFRNNPSWQINQSFDSSQQAVESCNEAEGNTFQSLCNSICLPAEKHSLCSLQGVPLQDSK